MTTKKEAPKKAAKKAETKKTPAKKAAKKEVKKPAKKQTVKKAVVKKEVKKQNEIKAQIIAKNLVTMVDGRKIVLKNPTSETVKIVSNKIKLYNKKNSDALLTEILAIIDVKEVEKEVKKVTKKGLEKVLKKEAKKPKTEKVVTVGEIIAAVADKKVEEEVKAKIEDKVELSPSEKYSIEQESIKNEGRPQRGYKHPVTGRTWSGERYS